MAYGPGRRTCQNLPAAPAAHDASFPLSLSRQQELWCPWCWPAELCGDFEGSDRNLALPGESAAECLKRPTSCCVDPLEVLTHAAVACLFLFLELLCNMYLFLYPRLYHLGVEPRVMNTS